MTDSLRSLVARSYKLRIVPGEILLAEVTIEVVAKDGTLNSLLTAIRECSVLKCALRSMANFKPP